MKMFRDRLSSGLFLLSSAVVFTGGIKAFAQASDSIPIVTIQATEPLASGSGVFTVFRRGDTNETLNVFYTIGGSASNGVDYAEISNYLTIPGGAISNTIVITPLAATSSSTVAKTVFLQLAPAPTLNPVNFEIGVPSNATVYIIGPNVTNLPPEVGVVSPYDGSVFYTPTNILLVAKASDSDGTVTNVEFFADSTDLGSGSPVVLDPPGVNGVTGLVYLLNWQDQNPFPTNYSLTAVATDNHGVSTVSSPVHISSLHGPSPPPNPYSIRIISPPDRAVFSAPVNVPLFAYVSYPTNSYVSGVDFFYDGTNSIGAGQPVPMPAPAANSSAAFDETNHLFYLVWTNPPVGSHVLIADTFIGFPNDVLMRLVSPPVDITVLASSPPPTNAPAIVNIVATDPVAVEGTNSWVWMGESNSPPTWAAWPAAVCRYFTNSGPKTATFTVRRTGETNDDLTVNYDIGGTASNGVDYVALPGCVSVPAGERYALITVIPVDNGPPANIKTVILTLDKSTNVPPDYVVGIPPRAAAVIVNPPGPSPVATALADRCFRLSLPGPSGAWFSIESSTDLVNWASICTNQVVNGSIDFIDPDAADYSGRYYRVVPAGN
jgi:hypothetical protein